MRQGCQLELGWPVIEHFVVVFLVIINAAIVGGLVFAIREAIRLRTIVDLSDERTRDPFTSTLAVLFSNTHGDAAIRKRQRRTINMFCGVVLLVFVSRNLIRQWLAAVQ